MDIETKKLIRQGSLVTLLVVVGVCLAGLVSALYLKVPLEGVVPVLVFCAVLYLFSKLLKGRSLPDSRFCMQTRILWLVVLLPAVSLLGQSALNLSSMDIDGRSSISYARNFWFVGSLWLLAGAGIAAASLERSNALALMLLAVLLALLWFGSDGVFLINYGQLSADSGGLRITHLTTSDYAVFCLAMAYGLSSGLGRVAVSLCALFILFALGGRAALFSFALAVLVMQIFVGQSRGSLRVLAGIVLGAVFLILYDYFGSLAQDSGASKDVLFSQGFGRDASVLERLEQIFLGFEDLGKQALFGDLSLVVRRFATAGGYMHNILSAWQFYGFLFFSLLVASLVYSLRFAYASHFWSDNSLHVAFHLLLVYVVISVLVGKAVTFYLLWLVLGYWLERAATSKPFSLA